MLFKRKEELETNRRKANEGCRTCKRCGEMNAFYVTLDGRVGGISTSYEVWSEGFLKLKHMRKDKYCCRTCGAEWESEPYEYE